MNDPIVIVGAGPAGASAALALARRGVPVLLCERAVFPRWKVCGCCLNARVPPLLESLGLPGLLDELGAVPLRTLEWASGPARVALPLGGRGRAVSREALDAALVRAAVAAGAEFRAETLAEPGPVTPEGRVVRLTRGGVTEEVLSPLVLAADGLSGRWLPVVVSPGSRVGAGGYVGLTRLEDNRLDAAAALDRDAVRHAGGPGPLAESLIAAAGWPVPEFPPGTWRGTPPLTRRAEPPGADRLLALGDAAGYVEPFTGEGISWALAAGAAIARVVENGWSIDTLANWRRTYRRGVKGRQWGCAAVAALLRRPRLARLAIRTAAAVPFLATPAVRRLHAGSA